MTDHDRLCELLEYARRYVKYGADLDMSLGASPATSVLPKIDAMLTRLRSSGPDGLRVLPVEPTHAQLKALAGDPLILAASDEAVLLERYAAMLKAAAAGGE